MMDRQRFDLEVKFASDKSGRVLRLWRGVRQCRRRRRRDREGRLRDTLRGWQDKGKFPPMLLQHGGGFLGGADDMLPVGKWTSMEENSKGLKVEGELFALNTERGQYIYEGLKAGSLDGLSIGYRVKEFEQGTKPGEPRRRLKALDLIELSIVTFPMNDKARVGNVKSIRPFVNSRTSCGTQAGSRMPRRRRLPRRGSRQRSLGMRTVPESWLPCGRSRNASIHPTEVNMHTKIVLLAGVSCVLTPSAVAQMRNTVSYITARTTWAR
jgi:HK97 family phage prohead protease